ncbi:MULTISPECIES: hypothetical protein [Haloarcula]|uniref:Uncharacterized protein n=1 Tax=Haloarcula pellucida TaxID=1427151 RepID=A0A830GG64_9EURY|nr:MULTISPECIES: hypothetical protein [Halomicroarcula]MBX0346866.1 hypothetical protein [Halomicroarcula pellucida]MDS0277260.1 hypothetical protein [Halomicroarcula sp. S1AR25-4]GGN85861.1 hypothetical protein GCM10009030_02860 [Halomicroarcula pellucida]
MATGSDGVVSGIRVDLRRLHETWMEIVYPRQRNAGDTVLGTWTPDSQFGMLLYRLWSAIGVPVIGLVYPLVLLGAFLRFQTRRIDGTATRLGVVGVVLLSVLVWGGLTALARFELDLVAGGVLAIGLAGVVATVSAALAVGARTVGGRGTTVALAYPFAMTAIFLPPVVAALFSKTLAAVVLPGSTALAQWLLDTLLAPVGLADLFSRTFDLEGAAYVVMWVAISFPVGWVLGLLVTLADFVRPTE